MKKVILLVFINFLIYEVKSNTYYFSTCDGDDSFTILQAQKAKTPWKSLSKLNSIGHLLLPGDSILFKAGEDFHGQINVRKSGTVNNLIYYGKYNDGLNPSINGFLTISNWVKVGNNLFFANIPEISSNLNLVSINDEIYEIGRFPNRNSKDDGYIPISSFTSGKVENPLLDLPFDFSGGEIVIRKNNWIIDRHPILSNSLKNVLYDTVGSYYLPKVGYGFFIQNHLATLDSHGEWYFDKEEKRIFIYFNGNPTEEIIKVAVLDEVVKVQNNVKNIIFENLTLIGVNENLVDLKGVSNFVFNQCDLGYFGKYAINSTDSNQLKISYTKIFNSLNGGIFLGWSDRDVVVNNCDFENIFLFPGMGKNGDQQSQAIFMSETTSNVIVENNVFFNCGFNAVNFSGDSILIKNNFINTFCFIKDDGGGIYSFGGVENNSYTKRKIVNNVVINGIGAKGGTKPYNLNDFAYVEGIYLDRNASNIEVVGNKIENVKSKGVFINNASNINVFQNHILNVGYSIFITNDKLSGPVNNISVVGNEFVCNSDSQLNYYLDVSFDSIGSLGFFDFNKFVYKKGVYENILLKNPSYMNSLSIRTWQKEFYMDLNSSFIEIDYP